MYILRNDLQTADLDGLAREAQLYSESLALNMIQLGRVYTEAKKLVRHGEWENWVSANGGMSVRSAQQLMAIYDRFGDRPALAGIEKSKLINMLALPEGTEDEFARENDVRGMSAREVKAAVDRARGVNTDGRAFAETLGSRTERDGAREAAGLAVEAAVGERIGSAAGRGDGAGTGEARIAGGAASSAGADADGGSAAGETGRAAENDMEREIREAAAEARREMQEKLDEQIRRTRAAEARLEALANRPAPVSEEAARELAEKSAETESLKTEIARLCETTREAIDEKGRAAQESIALKRDVTELEALLAERQLDYNSLQAELLRLKSDAAKGDAEREVSECVTAAEFAAAVREFLGAASTVPHMGRRFAAMAHEDALIFEENIAAVEQWVSGARAAVRTIGGELLEI